MDEFELKRALSWLLDENDCWGEDFIGTAIQCVKKQIPKEVLEQQDPNECGVYTGRCPNCRYDDIKSTRHKYCPECGQALKWTND